MSWYKEMSDCLLKEEGSNIRLFKKVCAGDNCRQQTNKEGEAVEKKNKELGL